MVALGRRIVVVGSTGSGKTTLARELSRRLGIPHIELDALHWGPDWTEVPDEEFRHKTSLAVGADAWVADGNYHQVRDIVWPRADTAVWLDYPLRTVIRQLAARTLGRCIRKETLWSGNRERWSTQFLSWDSLFLWLLKSYWRRRREYPDLFARPEYSHLSVARLKSPGRAREWLAGLAP